MFDRCYYDNLCVTHHRDEDKETNFIVLVHFEMHYILEDNWFI